MREKKWVRRTRHSLVTRIIASVAAFAVFLAIGGYATLRMAELQRFPVIGFYKWGIETLLVAIAFDVILAYIGARLVFLALSFTLRVASSEFCSQCNYNLTGNESGICPECGTPHVTSCGKCGYDLTGNESGKCPECGSTGEIEFPTNGLFFAGSKTLKWVLAGFLIWALSLFSSLALFVGSFLFVQSPFGTTTYSLGFLVTIAAVPIIAITCLRTSKSRSVRYICVIVLLCWTLMTLPTLISMWLTPEFTDLSPSKAALLQIPWGVAILGLHVMATVLCAKIPSKWCTRGLAISGVGYCFMQFLFYCSFFLMAGGFGGSNAILVVFAIPLSYYFLSAASLAIASFKIWKLIQWRTHYERTGEWPRY